MLFTLGYSLSVQRHVVMITLTVELYCMKKLHTGSLLTLVHLV